MKKKLMALLAAKEEQRKTLNQSMINSESKEERAAIGDTLAALGREISDIQAMLEEVDKPVADDDKDRVVDDTRALKVQATMQTRAATPKKAVDPYDTDEYRTAFMNFCAKGTPIPAELRADAVTTTTDAEAVIPTTILHEIISKFESYGAIYAQVRKLNVQGGVQIPVLSLKPTATWITADTGTSESDLQKLQVNTSISFSYYGLECKLAQTLLANVTTLEVFQNLFVPLAADAMAKALDIAIIKGTGNGQPTGITVDTRVPTGNVVTLSPDDVESWSAWKKKVFGKMAKSYREGKFFMAQSTFDGYIDGMVDSAGQPIGRVNYGIDGGERYRFGGKEVETVEDAVITSYDDANTNDIFAVFFDPKDYAINSNLSMQTVRWIDNDTNTIKNKVILICDGKLVDPNGVIIIKKGAASAKANS